MTMLFWKRACIVATVLLRVCSSPTGFNDGDGKHLRVVQFPPFRPSGTVARSAVLQSGQFKDQRRQYRYVAHTSVRFLSSPARSEQRINSVVANDCVRNCY